MNSNHNELNLEDWKNATLGETHRQTLKWVSHISFLHEEIAFMLKVISKHFSQFANAKHIHDTYDLTHKMEGVKNALSDLQAKLQEHERSLLDLYLTKDQKDEQVYRRLHVAFAKNLYRTLEKYKRVKKDFLIEAGDILKEEKHTIKGGLRIDNQFNE